MKRTLYITILVWGLLPQAMAQCPTTPATIDSECEKGKGITTDPDNPVNCEVATSGTPISWRLNDFDCRIQNPNIPQVQYYNDVFLNAWDAGNPKTHKIINPFTGPTTAEYYQTVSEGVVSDYNPEDGWELVKVEFGSPIGTAEEYFPKLPYMMLYNKYTATLRFFGVLLEPDATYKTVKVNLSIPKYSPNYDPTNPTQINKYQDNLSATNLLSIQGSSMQPLDQETTENTLSTFVKYTNNDDVFFWFDVPLAYDPCICEFKSQFDISFEFVGIADIEITGDISGTIKSTSSGGGAGKAIKLFNSILGAGIASGVAIKTGGAIVNVKAFTGLIDAFKTVTTSTNDKAALGALSGVLGCGVSFADYTKGDYSGISSTDTKKQVAAGKKLVDNSLKFFSTLDKGCGLGTSKSGGTVISGRINATGTVTTTDEIDDAQIELALPGSKWDLPLERRTHLHTNSKIIPAYPLYNERLGTFALLKTPQVSVKKIKVDACSTVYYPDYGEERVRMASRSTWSLRLNSNIEYTFNPKLNLNPEKTLIMARFVINKDAEFMKKGHFSDGTNYSCLTGLDKSKPMNMEYMPNSEYQIFSPYMPLDYIKSIPMRFSWANGKMFSTMQNYVDVGDWTAINNWFGENDLDLVKENIFIQFTISAESFDIGSDGKKNTIFQILTFPVNTNIVVDDPNGQDVVSNYESGVKNINYDIHFNEDKELYFEGPVIISSNISTDTDKKLKIYSINGFELTPGASIAPNVELIPHPHLQKDPQDEKTYSEIRSFCNSTSSYKAKTFASSAIKNMEEMAKFREENRKRAEKEALESMEIDIKLFPNPAKQAFTLELSKNMEDLTVSLADINGREVNNSFFKQFSTGTMNIEGLQPGVYFVTIRSNGTPLGVKRLVVQ